MATDRQLRSRVVAEVEGEWARALIEDERLEIGPTELRDGAIALVRRSAEGRGEVLRALAEPDTALAELHHLAAECGIDVAFGERAAEESERLARDPGIDDPRLLDRTELPFVTIDGAGARDLDQAVYVERFPSGGWRVHYAIADAAHFVSRSSALWDEALRRGASFYLPGLSIPMLPRPLSEGVVSLNPDGPRRALIFEMDLDAQGMSLGTRLVRGRIRSRAKLSFDEVQMLFDAPEESGLVGSEAETSLRAMAEVGRARLREAVFRDVVRYQRREVDVALEGAKGDRFVVLESVRRDVELWNEQISLLCNAEGARLLAESANPRVQPIYRIHPPPDPERVESLRATIAAVALAHGLDPDAWIWDERASLAEYVASLPIDGPSARVARAIQRQAIMVNVRSTYATEPSVHHGAGFEPYARFSAPMREVVGVYLHAEAAQLLSSGAGDAMGSDEEESLRQRVVDAANRSKEVQRRITDLVNRRVIDRVFAPELARAREERHVWTGTVMGIGGGKLHVQLDRPAIDVKLYFADLGRAWDAFLVADELGVVLRDRDRDRVMARVGDPIGVRLVERDEGRDRWVLEPIGAGAG
jgi:ribonuclease R